MAMENDREKEEEHLDFYADGSLVSADAKVPKWLKWVYIIMPLWGILWFFLFWNGSTGWLDRGYWGELQKAANTTTTNPFKEIIADKPPT